MRRFIFFCFFLGASFATLSQGTVHDSLRNVARNYLTNLEQAGLNQFPKELSLLTKMVEAPRPRIGLGERENSIVVNYYDIADIKYCTLVLKDDEYTLYPHTGCRCPHFFSRNTGGIADFTEFHSFESGKKYTDSEAWWHAEKTIVRTHPELCAERIVLDFFFDYLLLLTKRYPAADSTDLYTSLKNLSDWDIESLTFDRDTVFATLSRGRTKAKIKYIHDNYDSDGTEIIIKSGLSTRVKLHAHKRDGKGRGFHFRIWTKKSGWKYFDTATEQEYTKITRILIKK